MFHMLLLKSLYINVSVKTFNCCSTLNEERLRERGGREGEGGEGRKGEGKIKQRQKGKRRSSSGQGCFVSVR